MKERKNERKKERKKERSGDEDLKAGFAVFGFRMRNEFPRSSEIGICGMK